MSDFAVLKKYIPKTSSSKSKQLRCGHGYSTLNCRVSRSFENAYDRMTYNHFDVGQDLYYDDMVQTLHFFVDVECPEHLLVWRQSDYLHNHEVQVNYISVTLNECKRSCQPSIHCSAVIYNKQTTKCTLYRDLTRYETAGNVDRWSTDIVSVYIHVCSTTGIRQSFRDNGEATSVFCWNQPMTLPAGA
ncbi:hypothetical protein EG68_03711 [Paragonimus skrjabini miyazakii]|uniref:Apple domain-containing protein n=1 Tax=Paragonimus skrjabini miyazakii TaxID=59628 RepID=A0A8S9Z2B7_9TREM|nr:hypothetical protein EG68_03711 [Paragonimus skrjabini miyazakii]